MAGKRLRFDEDCGRSLLTSSAPNHSSKVHSGDDEAITGVTSGGCIRAARFSGIARNGCMSFNAGLTCAISLTTVLSLVVLTGVELYRIKSELLALQRQVNQLREHQETRHHDQQELREINQIRQISNPPETSKLSVEVWSDSEDYGRISSNKKVKRNAQQKRSINRPGQENDVTLEQVRRIIYDSFSLLYHPSAHLACYFPSSHSNSTNSRVHSDDHALYWTDHHASGITHNNLFGYGADYSRLVVQTSGTFYIYVQVMYNGRRTSHQPTCSHVVKLFPSEETHNPRLLLFSSTTQYNLGRPIYIQYDGDFVRAFDSSFQAGIFHLESGDQLRVELDDFSRNCRIIPHVDRTYFGGFRLYSADLPVNSD